MAVLADTAHPLADALRVTFLIAAGCYFGIAYATLRRYMNNPPRSRLRKIHVWGVSTGTSILVAGFCGLIFELMGEPLQWYGAPVAVSGVAMITASLFVLYRDQSAYVDLGSGEIPVRDRRVRGRRGSPADRS